MAPHDPSLIVLAGGISSRMKLPTSTGIDDELKKQAAERTKGMIGVGAEGRPFLDYLLYYAREAGLREVLVVIGERDHAVRAYYGEQDRGNPFHGLTISYAVQTIPPGRVKPLGTGDALYQALSARPDWSGGDFIVCNSDNLYSIRAFRMLLEDGAPNSLIDYDRSGLEFEENRIAQFGVTKKDAEGHLLEIIEKPPAKHLEELRDKDGTLRISMNIFRLQYDMIVPFLKECPLHPVRQEKELVAAVTRMAQKVPRSVKALPLKEHVPDLTYQGDIPKVQEFIGKHFPASLW
ncbi:MAG: NTP transferase domain-containing protein [Ignavibacteriales bacterium]|nr:NTP transferase domain-containing protein [Ignavibacteriales bacterium]